MNELRSWATEWVTRLVADGGAHGPGSRRTIAVDDHTWHYLMDETGISGRLHELQQPSHQRPGRYAVTYEQTIQAIDSLHIYAVEFSNHAPPERVHLAQPFRKLLMGATRPNGPIIEFADESVRPVPAPTAGTEHGDESARYWSARYDRPQENPWLNQPQPPAQPLRPRGKQQLMRDNVAGARTSAATPPPPAPQPGAAPQVRSAAEALGSARRYLDAALMAGFGILCFVVSDARTTEKPAIVVIVGIVALLYSGYIALSRGGYVMPYLIYALAILAVAFFLFK